MGQLEGDAANLISGFSYSHAQYDEAVNLLRDTYGQDCIIIQSRLNAIFDLKSPEPNYESLKQF